MTIVSQVQSARVTRLRALIIFAVLLALRDPPTTVVNGFTSIFTGVRPSRSNFHKAVVNCRQGHTETPITCRWAHGNQIKIRDWRSTDNEPKKIYNFFRKREQHERRAESNFYDPEGPLELDVMNEMRLAESYSKDDGGCFIVAVEGENSEIGDDNIGIVGTLGMISGTEVSYQSSGSSYSKPEITAAIRRVCASRTGVDEDDITKDAQITSTTDILEALIRQGEQRALQSGATNIIGLAYSETTDISNSEVNRIAKPTVNIFETLGYRVSEQQIQGVTTVQYEKKLSVTQSMNQMYTSPEPTTKNDWDGIWVVPVTIATIVSLGFLVFNLYSNVFGIEQLWGSTDNGGVGTSLSTENLEELIRDEKLGRSGLDDGIGISRVRQWEDLSPEELREEQALIKVIQGQPIRTK